ncbi:beta-1,4-galactosyltransferase galt-1-like [Tachypleus tridentatus]|uniref:beta-1,4-galactosyltransferase galt-1-like n=1 Tax=Tachypleus tridentatus TaxID=6853 RepID=UPI003FD66BB6
MNCRRCFIKYRAAKRQRWLLNCSCWSYFVKMLFSLLLLCCGSYIWMLVLTSTIVDQQNVADFSKNGLHGETMGGSWLKSPSVRVTKSLANQSEDRLYTIKNSKRLYVNIWNTHVDQWQRANMVSAPYKLMVYSAYLDKRNPHAPTVVVIGATLIKGGLKVYCKLQFSHKKPVLVAAYKRVINEHWNLKYSACFFYCALRKGDPKPLNVSVADNSQFKAAAILTVYDNKEDNESPRGRIALCVKPLHYSYDRATWFIEFVELHRLLGVEHFFLYNHSMGHSVERAVMVYKQLGVVSLLPWNLEIQSQKEIRTEGLFAALNDCLYRSMCLFKYVLMLDLDEFIIPSGNVTYETFLADITKLKRGPYQPSSFVFQNVFFYLYWDNDTSAYNEKPETPPANIPYLLTQYKTRRLKYPMKHGSRSKFIVVPERVLEVGNHVVWRVVPRSQNIKVPFSKASLHHYRICENGGHRCLKQPSVVDRTALRFNSTLLSRVQYICHRSFVNVNTCPVVPPLGSEW